MAREGFFIFCLHWQGSELGLVLRLLEGSGMNYKRKVKK